MSPTIKTVIVTLRGWLGCGSHGKTLSQMCKNKSRQGGRGAEADTFRLYHT